MEIPNPTSQPPCGDCDFANARAARRRRGATTPGNTNASAATTAAKRNPATATAAIPAAATRRWFLFATALLAAACADRGAPMEPPATLGATGLFADASGARIADDALPFAPQYPLWSDGAAKRRWIALPPGTTIDARDPDDWQFPIGTRLWKQFAFAAGAETRFMQRRPDGSWLYATYLHGAAGAAAAALAPADGVRAFCATSDGAHHDVPSVADCRACHKNGRSPVLGFAALQLSTDRDPLAPHAETAPAGGLDLAGLRARGWLRGLPAHVGDAPRIAARTPTERAALGYLHGNCGSCHGRGGALQRLGMRLDQPLAPHGAPPPAIATTVGVDSSFRDPAARARIVAGDAAASLLWRRVAAADALTRMPPFGRNLVDRDARDLLARWIDGELPQLRVPPAAAPATEPNRKP